MWFLVVLSLLAPAPTSPVRSIAEINWRFPDGNLGYCTGVQVSINTLLTSDHCAPDGLEISVDGKPTRVIKKEEDTFALLQTEIGRPIIKIAQKEPAFGEEVFSYGNAFNNRTHVLSRMVSRVFDGIIVLDGPLAPGMSGGPVINQNGELVGINQAANQIFGFATGVKEIRAFLKLSK